MIAVTAFREISELAFYGAKVLHPLAVRPMIEHGGTHTHTPGGSDARKFRAHGPRARYFQARLFFSSTPFSVKVSVSLRPK